MGKKRRNRQGKPGRRVISISRYTWDAWKRIYPEGTREQYNDSQQPHSIIELLMNYEGFMKEKMDVKGLWYRIVMIDGSYFDWLDREGLSDSEDARLKYITGMPDAEAKELFEKDGLNYERKIGLLTFVVHVDGMVRKTEFMLSAGARRSLTKYLENIYPDCGVTVPGYIVSPNDFPMVADFLKSYDGSVLLYRTELLSQTSLEEVNTKVLSIPFLLDVRRKGILFNIDEELASEDLFIERSLNRKDLRRDFGVIAEDFEKSPARNDIVESVRAADGTAEVFTVPFAVDEDDYENFITDLYDTLFNEMERMAGNEDDWDAYDVPVGRHNSGSGIMS